MNIPSKNQLRKGQLLMNFLWWLANTKEYKNTILNYADIFYIADEELERYFKEYLEEIDYYSN